MEMNMGKFSEKLVELLELAKKNDNTDYLIPEGKIRVVEGDTL